MFFHAISVCVSATLCKTSGISSTFKTGCLWSCGRRSCESVSVFMSGLVWTSQKELESYRITGHRVAVVLITQKLECSSFLGSMLQFPRRKQVMAKKVLHESLWVVTQGLRDLGGKYLKQRSLPFGWISDACKAKPQNLSTQPPRDHQLNPPTKQVGWVLVIIEVRAHCRTFSHASPKGFAAK